MKITGQCNIKHNFVTFLLHFCMICIIKLVLVLNMHEIFATINN